MIDGGPAGRPIPDPASIRVTARRLPPGAREALRLADEATADATALLVRDCGMTMADAAQALGLSRRHVQLLLTDQAES